VSKSTQSQHPQPWERAIEDGSLSRQRAAVLGSPGDEMSVRLLSRRPGFIDTRKSWGLLSLEKHYRAEQSQAACRRALERDQLSYRAVKGFLEWEEGAALERSTPAAAPTGQRPGASSPRPADTPIGPLSV
jgi:hypothetical protein